ncbi:hypothetical protein L1887_52166 [Cichorium endivia]|nr:hypothetical protein L1887_52166 [Cichorium endivia]
MVSTAAVTIAAAVGRVADRHCHGATQCATIQRTGTASRSGPEASNSLRIPPSDRVAAYLWTCARATASFRTTTSRRLRAAALTRIRATTSLTDTAQALTFAPSLFDQARAEAHWFNQLSKAELRLRGSAPIKHSCVARTVQRCLTRLTVEKIAAAPASPSSLPHPHPNIDPPTPAQLTSRDLTRCSHLG